jgi:hypothetical protein
MPIEQQRNITMADEKAQRLSESSFSKEEAGMVTDVIDKKAESNYVRKLDFYLLPFLSVMYFFNRQVHFLGTHLCSIQLVDSTKVLTVRTWEMRKRMVWTKILALPANSIAC